MFADSLLCSVEHDLYLDGGPCPQQASSLSLSPPMVTIYALVLGAGLIQRPFFLFRGMQGIERSPTKGESH